jgi:hypothetical protein
MNDEAVFLRRRGDNNEGAGASDRESVEGDLGQDKEGQELAKTTRQDD